VRGRVYQVCGRRCRRCRRRRASGSDFYFSIRAERRQHPRHGGEDVKEEEHQR